MQARDIMRTELFTVRPDMPLWELEEVLLRERILGAPVVEGDRLLGVVSRSDMLRQAQLEEARVSASAGWYLEPFDAEQRQEEDDRRLRAVVGARMREVPVRDAMSTDIVSVPPSASVNEVARTLAERRIHRVLVLEDGRLVGLVTALDLVGLIAGGQLQAS